MSADYDKARTFSLLALALVALGFALYFLRGIFAVLFLSISLAFATTPLVDFFQRRMRLPRALALLLTALVLLAGFGVLAGLIMWSVRGINENFDFYRDRVLDVIAHVAGWLNRWGINLGQHEMMEAIRSLPVLQWVQAVIGSAASFFGNLVVVLFLTIYFVSQRRPGRPLQGFWGDVERTVRAYLDTKLITAITTSTIAGLVLWFFGVNLFLFFAVMTFILDFIPMIGGLIAVLLPIPIAFLQFGLTKTLVMTAILIGIQQVIGNYLEPKLMGRSLDLHPAAVLIALMFWGVLLGPIGMLLAAPLTVALKIVFESNEASRPLGRLLGGNL